MSSEKKIEVKPKKTRRPPPPSFPPNISQENDKVPAPEHLEPNNNVEDMRNEAKSQRIPEDTQAQPQEITSNAEPALVASTQCPVKHSEQFNSTPQDGVYMHYSQPLPNSVRYEHPRSEHSPNRTSYDRRGEDINQRGDVYYRPYENYHPGYPQDRSRAPVNDWTGYASRDMPPQYRLEERLHQHFRYPGQSPGMFSREVGYGPTPDRYGGAPPPGHLPYRQPYHAQPYYNAPHYPGVAHPSGRRAPPSDDYPAYQGNHSFRPYVDSDFTHHHPSQPTPVTNSLPGTRDDVLGENRPSTFSVSVTSLPSGRPELQEGESPSSTRSTDSSNNGLEEMTDNDDANSSDSRKENERAVTKKNGFISPEKKGLSVSDKVPVKDHKNNSDNIMNQMNQMPGPESDESQNDSLFFLKRNPSANPLSPSNTDVEKKQTNQNSRKSKQSSKASKKFTGYRKCLIMRDRKGLKNRLNPTYNLYSQDVAPGAAPQLIMIAQKTTSRTPNYRLFDMTKKSNTTDKLDKHSRNYVGKLRGNFNRDEYTAYSRDKEVVCAVVFDKSDVISQIRDGALPRKMGVLLPYDKVAKALESTDSSTVLSPNKVERRAYQLNHSSDEETKSDEEVVVEKLSPEARLAGMFNQVENKLIMDNGNLSGSNSDDEERKVTTSIANIMQGKLGKSSSSKSSETSKQYLQLSSKEPTYEKQNYRLNFHGRVKLPSVKNYQLIQPDGDADNIWTQFGKVTEDKFHLDYKEPLDMFTAFALAITQFDY